MSWTHCAWASKQTTGSAINKLVLMMMADATSHDNPLLILRIKTLSEKCESSESSVKRAIKDLESLGLLICVERFFENTQQSNAYILVTNEINPSDAEKIAKENERSGCFFKIRGGGGVHSEPRVGSQGTQGGFTVTPRATPSSSLPSFKEPIATLAPLTRMSPDEQQPESAGVVMITTPSQALAQAPDQPLSSRATPHSPLPPSPRKRFVPPTEEEWLAYCKLTFPKWKNSAAQSVHAYYESVAWKDKVDWKACAKTCFHRAKQLDLQPAQTAAPKPRETPAERRAREDREGREWFAAQGGVMPE